MPSFQDSAFIILLGLLLFGPKGLAKIARQVGKLVGEFRRASAEFRMQMEDELRVSEQEEQKKKIAAMEAAAPPPVLTPSEPEAPHPHMPPVEGLGENRIGAVAPVNVEPVVESAAVEALPIATADGVRMMPPETGLPVGRRGGFGGSPGDGEAGLGGVFDSIPQKDEAEVLENG